jgi:predicted kinase
MSKTTQMAVIDRDIGGSHQLIFSSMIVLVGGLPGTGKNFFSLRLSEKIHATYINSDRTRKEIDSQGRYAFEDKLNVYEEMAQRTAEALRRGKAVIVDATFYCRQMREIFFTLAKLMHLKLAFIEIVADEKVLRKRLRSTKASLEADLSVHNFVKTQYEQPDIDHLVIESKDDNIDEMLWKAIDYISKVSHEL